MRRARFIAANLVVTTINHNQPTLAQLGGGGNFPSFAATIKQHPRLRRRRRRKENAKRVFDWNFSNSYTKSHRRTQTHTNSQLHTLCTF